MCARAKQTRRIGWIGLGTMGLPMYYLADKAAKEAKKAKKAAK